MLKFRIHGRGGQGGVTLAKIIAFMFWTKGKWVQAFGSYAAERTGAPILAFTLIDDNEITNRSQIYKPDHLIILDPTLLNSNILAGLQPNAYLVIDTPHPPEYFKEFIGHRVAALDAKKIARKHKLGTKATPITNTAIAGALAKVFDLDFSIVEKTIEALQLPGTNLEAAKDAYDMVAIGSTIPGKPKEVPVPSINGPVPPLVTGNLGTEPKLNVSDWKSQKPVYADDHIPPCNFNCPAGNNIQKFISELTKGDYDAALAVLKETSPLPGTTARVCPHPCEDFCNRSSIDGRVNIHALERLAADKGRTALVKPDIEREERIAIIGSGPAGLSAGYQLRRMGYQPIIFESLPEPGGMLRAGIPDYRLPKEVLDEEIKFIVDSGVEIKCNAGLQSKEQFKKLVDEYDAVVIAVGLSIGQVIGLDNADETPGVMQGIDFLQQVNFGNPVDIGSKVIVIGGGNTAIDASRSALRLGAEEVNIIYRRSLEEMPAIKEEIDAAMAEGVKIKFLHAPHHIVREGRRRILRVQEMKLGEPDDSGRRRPIPIPNAFKNVEFTSLILATGQISGLDFLTDDIEVVNGFIKANEHGFTSHKKVFASGDVVTNDGTVTHAIGEGRKIAMSVDCMLRGIELPSLNKDESMVVTAEQMNLYYFTPSSRKEIAERPTDSRIQDFEEVNLGIEDITEAFRCLSCGVCNGCYPDNIGKCELFCPERSIHRVNSTKLGFDYDGCKGCLICMEVCPRDAIARKPLKEEGVTNDR